MDRSPGHRVSLVGVRLTLTMAAAFAVVTLIVVPPAAAIRHTFPLMTTQAAIKHHTPTWCYWSLKNCHGGYRAADIFIKPGTRTRAIVAGEVITRTEVGHCSTAVGGSAHLQIEGVDGRYYFYTHMAAGSLRVKLHAHVRRGQLLGRVGRSRCAQGTSPHLDIQMNNSVIYGDANSKNIQPMLVRLFSKLPDR